jgi:hypothetical protein
MKPLSPSSRGCECGGSSKRQAPNSKEDPSSKIQASRREVASRIYFASSKAALKRPHSKRSARYEACDASRQRLECGLFSAAFPQRQTRSARPTLTDFPPLPQGEGRGEGDRSQSHVVNFHRSILASSWRLRFGISLELGTWDLELSPKELS